MIGKPPSWADEITRQGKRAAEVGFGENYRQRMWRGDTDVSTFSAQRNTVFLDLDW